MFFTSYSITPHILTIAKNKEPSDSKLTHASPGTEGESVRKRKTTFLFDFICNSRICIIPFAELFFVDGYFGPVFVYVLAQWDSTHVYSKLHAPRSGSFWISSNSNQTDCELLAFLCSFICSLFLVFLLRSLSRSILFCLSLVLFYRLTSVRWPVRYKKHKHNLWLQVG